MRESSQARWFFLARSLIILAMTVIPLALFHSSHSSTAQTRFHHRRLTASTAPSSAINKRRRPQLKPSPAVKYPNPPSVAPRHAAATDPQVPAGFVQPCRRDLGKHPNAQLP